MDKNRENISLQQAAQDLANFAIDRTDLKNLLGAIPDNNSLNMTTIEYELQILKILSVGWAISFYMATTNKNKAPITQMFWEFIREISQNISTLTETTTGKNLDYFEILKQRLNTYIEIMKEKPDVSHNPANIMGPAFADICNQNNDAIAILTGTKMFTLTLGAVKEYLDTVKIEKIKLN
ncbi:MAG: hypothetical protein GY857_05230 [Desulfobacula sp.]|nr:hypothetical protein [Desulfobacula sp.]